MKNYMRFVGHYKKMVVGSLCDDIINTDFQYSKSTYSTHVGLSPDDERVKMDEIWMIAIGVVVVAVVVYFVTCGCCSVA